MFPVGVNHANSIHHTYHLKGAKLFGARERKLGVREFFGGAPKLENGKEVISLFTICKINCTLKQATVITMTFIVRKGKNKAHRIEQAFRAVVFLSYLQRFRQSLQQSLLRDNRAGITLSPSPTFPKRKYSEAMFRLAYGKSISSSASGSMNPGNMHFILDD